MSPGNSERPKHDGRTGHGYGKGWISRCRQTAKSMEAVLCHSYTVKTEGLYACVYREERISILVKVVMDPIKITH